MLNSEKKDSNQSNRLPDLMKAAANKYAKYLYEAAQKGNAQIAQVSASFLAEYSQSTSADSDTQSEQSNS